MWHGRGADFCCSPRDLPIPLLSRPAPCAFLREQRANPQFRAITKSSSSPSIAVPVLGVTKVRRARRAIKTGRQSPWCTLTRHRVGTWQSPSGLGSGLINAADGGAAAGAAGAAGPRASLPKQLPPKATGPTPPPAAASASASASAAAPSASRRASKKPGSSKAVLGTPDYLAPELLLGTGHGSFVNAPRPRKSCVPHTPRYARARTYGCRPRGRLVGSRHLPVRVPRRRAPVHRLGARAHLQKHPE